MRYPGGKNADGVWQRIISAMPPHLFYVEPFFGSGAVFAHKRPAVMGSVLVDKDRHVIDTARKRFAGVDQGAAFLEGDAFEAIREYGSKSQDVLVYCDPPYLPETRVKQRIYKHELSAADHQRLLDLLRGLPCKVMLSGYRSALYDDALVGWHRKDYQVMTRGGPRVESLWCNFEPGLAFHDPRRFGADYRERERIKKKRDRWAAKFRAMPAGERAVIAAALREVGADPIAVIDGTPPPFEKADLAAGVAVLFARANSNYKKIPGLDVYDAARDARNFRGGRRVIAHPPCRLWGQLHALSTAPPEEKELGRFAVDMVRQHGGVLEHPRGSKLWADKAMAKPGSGVDAWGGWTVQLNQVWFGHKCEKATWLYIVGCPPESVPPFAHQLAEPTHVVTTSQRHRAKKLAGLPTKLESSQAIREYTPPALCEWLIEVAAACRAPAGAVRRLDTPPEMAVPLHSVDKAANPLINPRA